MKKIYILLLSMMMLFAFSACGTSGQAAEGTQSEGEAAAGAVTGGWELADNEAADLPEDVRNAFDKAAEKYTDAELKPVAYIASQVVAGMNYMILCEAETAGQEPPISYQMVIIYADLEGNAEITHITNVDPADFNQ